MSKIENPHIAFPFRLDANGKTLVKREQGSDEEVEDKVIVLLSTPIGSREEVPMYGIVDPVLRQNGASLQDIGAAISMWEPRANYSLRQVGEILSDLTQHIEIKIGSQDG